MGFDTATFTGKCDINEIFIVSQILKGWCYAALIVVPAETEMLRFIHGVCRDSDIEELGWRGYN